MLGGVGRRRQASHFRTEPGRPRVGVAAAALEFGAGSVDRDFCLVRSDDRSGAGAFAVGIRHHGRERYGAAADTYDI